MNNEIKAIVFDMGGVIIMTCDDTPRQKLAQDLGVSIEHLKNEVFYSQTAIMSETGLLSKYDHWSAVLKGLGFDLACNLKEIDAAFWAGDYIDNELMNYIQSLKKKYQIGLLSNAFKSAREWLNNSFDFLDAFDVSVFSYEVGMRKPDPAIFQLMCEKMNVLPSQTVFIDDMLVNVEGAQRAGMCAIHFQGRDKFIKELESILSS